MSKSVHVLGRPDTKEAAKESENPDNFLTPVKSTFVKKKSVSPMPTNVQNPLLSDLQKKYAQHRSQANLAHNSVGKNKNQPNFIPVPKLDAGSLKKKDLENVRRSKSTEYEIFKGEKELNEESDDQGGASSGSSGEDINQSALES